MLSTIERAALFFVTLGLGGCSSASQVPVGTNVSPLARDDGGSAGNDSACAAIPVAAIACAVGPTVQACDTSTTPPKWVFSCPDEVDSGASPCGNKPINTIGCPSSEPTITCDTSDATPHWTVTCPADTDASNGTTTSSDASTACDNLPVETIGCASGNPTYTCVTTNGAPHWNVGCQ